MREGKFDPGKHKLTEALFATPQLETVLSRGVLLRPIGGPTRNRSTCPVAPSRALVDLLIPTEADGTGRSS